MARLHYSDRSRFEKGNDCMRSLYWGYYHPNGTPVPGIVPIEDKAHLLFGKAIHATVEGEPEDVALHMTDIYNQPFNPVTPDGYDSYDEWESLEYGLRQTYERFVLPRILEEYEWVSSELEMTMKLGWLMWMTRLDGVLRRKSDAKYFVLEAKTTSHPDRLLAQSRRNFQLLMELESLRRWTGLEAQETGGALLLMFNKGKKQRASKKERDNGKDGYRRLSPFTYWWGREIGNNQWEYSLTYSYGWERIPVWRIHNWYEIALEHWPDEVRGQVQLWPTVDFDPERTTSVIDQVLGRESAGYSFEGSPNGSVDHHFPQNFQKCEDMYGEPCPYLDACFSPRINRDPLKSGLYVPRVPNHPQENQVE